MEAKLSTKGQIVIPKEIRKHLGLKPGDKVKLEVMKEKKALIQPAANLPQDVFFRAGANIVGDALEETHRADEAKIRALLKSLGVSY